MTTRLTLICHAATAATRRAAFPADEPIEVEERARCAALAALLAGAELVRSGPEQRCRDTAAALDLAAEAVRELRDCDYGRWAGRSLRDLEQEDEAGIAAWITDPAAAPHGGESLLALLDRVGRWLAALPASGHVIAVTHASVIRATLVVAMQVPPQAFWRLDILPLSRTELSAVRGRWTVRAVGCVAAQPGVISD